MCLCQGITRFLGHADPNLFETGRRIINKEYDKNDIMNMISFFVYKKIMPKPEDNRKLVLLDT